MDFNFELNYRGFENYLVINGPILDGVQYIFRFDNSYGASVVKFDHTYGYDLDLWELAVIWIDENGDCSLVYDTPVTDDVIGYLTDAEVCELLGEIRDLPKRLPLIAESQGKP